MIDSTTNGVLAVNCPAQLPSRVLSFGRWLHRWYRDTGDVSAATPYFARKQRVTERTIYRWLRQLREGGYISCEVLPGVEREIVPARSLPPKRREGSGVRQGRGSGVRPASPLSTDAWDAQQQTPPTEPPSPEPVAVPAVVVGVEEAGKAETGQEPEALRLLLHGTEGRLPEPDARLIAAAGPWSREQIRQAVAAFRAAKGVQNPVGWIRRALERGYLPPRRAGQPQSEPSSNPWNEEAGDRARARYLGAIPPEEYAQLERRARGKLRELGREFPTIESVAEYMAKAWRYKPKLTP